MALLLGAQPGERVVDYCAGSGGKSLVLGAEMGNKGRVLAMDIEASRLERSAPRLRKAGIDNVETHLIDPGPTDKWLKRRKRSFDRVLVDAPCSGVAHGGATPTLGGCARHAHWTACSSCRPTSSACRAPRSPWGSASLRYVLAAP